MVETALWGVLSVALAVAFALGGFAVARRLVSFDLREAQGEAGGVEGIHRVAEGFPEAERREVQDLAGSYARIVVEEGWPMMREEGRISGRAGTKADELRRSVVAFEPRTGREDALYSRALALVGSLDEYREQRSLEVREGIPSIHWVVLIP